MIEKAIDRTIDFLAVLMLIGWLFVCIQLLRISTACASSKDSDIQTPDNFCEKIVRKEFPLNRTIATAVCLRVIEKIDETGIIPRTKILYDKENE